MQSGNSLDDSVFIERLKTFFYQRWDLLTDKQKGYSRKVWGVLTYKWRWQIAMNIPYLAIFLLDRSIPAVHNFNIALLNNVYSKLPIPEVLQFWNA